jgi:integrase
MSGRVKDGLIKRGSTWAYVIRVPDPRTGRSKPKWVGGFASEAEAKAARDEARVRARRGEYVDRSRVTVAEYLDDWLDSHAVEVKPRTMASYRYLVENYVVPRIGATPVQAVRPAAVSAMYRQLLESGGRSGKPLSKRTVDYIHAVLRKAFNDAVHVERLLTSNPVERAKRPKGRRESSNRIWTPAELRSFLEAAADHPYSVFYRVAAYTGARRGELLFLRWKDLDLSIPEVRLRGSAGIVDGARVEGTTKGGRERRVSLDAETAAMLAEHRRVMQEKRLLVGGEWEGGDYVFTTDFGKLIYPDTVSQAVPRIIAKANKARTSAGLEPLPHARLHDLRHVHATTLLLSGVPVHVVADRLGHADPSITLRVYAHVLHERAGEVADVFAAAVSSGQTEPVETPEEEAP